MKDKLDLFMLILDKVQNTSMSKIILVGLLCLLLYQSFLFNSSISKMNETIVRNTQFEMDLVHDLYKMAGEVSSRLTEVEKSLNKIKPNKTK